MKTFLHKIGWATGALALLLALPLSAQQLDMEKLAGMSARSIGPAGMSGRVTSIDAVVRDPDVIYVGTSTGGVWKSTDGATTFTPIFDDQPVASIGAVAINQMNPDVIWVGTGEGNPRNSQSSGNGVYKSIDGGRTWTHLGFDDSRNIHRVIIHPTNPEIVYVGVQGSAWGEHGGRGVWKTTDGGATWDNVLEGDTKTGIADLVMDPENPDKLIAAMWEFRRWPHFFKSGGPESGIFVTFDGGKTWAKRTSDDGLPAGDLGRIGLGISTNKPNVVYALVEAKKNGLYRSDDGGFSWRLINDDNNVNSRPFYYADIRVDPQNENRIFSLSSSLRMSEDGGQSFNTIGQGIHPDHHAMWINPNDSDFIIEGNDGGAYLSRNGGKTWRFVESLPLAQFYHIRVDMAEPYNVYGGLQDNGSWRGPTWFLGAGGIRNNYWEEVGFGDGFDVVPDPLNPRYGYAMSQGGNLSRFDRATGERRGIRPWAPDDTALRFNWNAAIAIDPFDHQTIYYGSQFVHKSPDHGQTWEIISPDLTTNDASKQDQINSGGLTYDVTAAENFTSIVAIALSPIQQGVIWAGTDDGHVQVTQDGGQNWTNVIGNMRGVPEGTWVPQITASTYNAGEAFVVLEDHRRNNWEPYVYHTQDFGRSWNRLADSDKVWGYALSFAQDPIEPNLMFLGTEFGLYVTIDGGDNWTKWTNGVPTTSVMDLVIHPREHDLVIGTFGRSIFVLDDIRPLRGLAQQGAAVLDETVHVFDQPEGVRWLTKQADGMRFPGDAEYRGENRRMGAMISYVANPTEGGPSAGMDDEQRQEMMARMRQRMGPRAQEMMARMGGDRARVRIDILDASGQLINRMNGPAEPGVNRVYWDMNRQFNPEQAAQGAQRGGGGFAQFFRRSGAAAAPGTYTVRIRNGRSVDSTTLTIKLDPRKDMSQVDLVAKAAHTKRTTEAFEVAQKATRQLNEAKEAIETVTARLRSNPDENARGLMRQAREMTTAIDDLLARFNGPQNVQGIRRDPNTITSSFFGAFSNSWDTPTQSEQIALRQAEQRLSEGLNDVNTFFANDFSTFQQAVEALNLPIVETFETLALPASASQGNNNN